MECTKFFLEGQCNFRKATVPHQGVQPLPRTRIALCAIVVQPMLDHLLPTPAGIFMKLPLPPIQLILGEADSDAKLPPLGAHHVLKVTLVSLVILPLDASEGLQ